MSETHDHDLGLQHDLRVLIGRRRALGLLGSAAAAGLVAACDSLPGMPGAQADVVGVSPSGAECVADPEETAGPYPGDGSNEAHGTLVNVLEDSGVVREDIRSGFGGMEGLAEGSPLAVELTLVDVGNSCAPLANHAIYLWHCDHAGRYSIYSLPDTNYLRGVGVTDSQGRVRFQTIFPGCYDGRYPHMHFEVYRSLTAATDYRHRALTSQLAMPAHICRQVYDGVSLYSESVENFAGSPLERDNVFRDNTPKQIAAQTPQMSGDKLTGLLAVATIGLAV